MLGCLQKWHWDPRFANLFFQLRIDMVAMLVTLTKIAKQIW
jgi:hypothetical protein